MAVPPGKAFAEAPPKTLWVRLTGSGWQLMFDYLAHPVIVLQYNLEAYAQYRLTQRQLRNDISRKISFDEIRIDEISVGDIDLRLEDQAVRRVPIILRDSLTFAPGYHLLPPPLLSLDSVTVTGPVSVVEQIVGWETQLLTLSNLKGNVVRSVPLVKPPASITLSISEVQVTIRVEQFTEKSLFVPLQVRNAPDSLRYFPQMVKVTCAVGMSTYNDINAADFIAEIDLAQAVLSEGKNTLPIQLKQSPPYVHNVQFTPKSAEFFIVRR